MPDNESRPWDRLPGEPDAAWEAFRRFRDMPSAQRSVRRLAEIVRHERDDAEEHGLSIAAIPRGDYATLARWSREYHWPERARAWDAEVDRVWQEEQLEAVREAARRQWENSRKLQEIGTTALEYIDTEQLAQRFPQEVRRYIVEGAEMERQLLGMNKKEEEAIGSPLLIIQVVEQLAQQLGETDSSDIVDAVEVSELVSETASVTTNESSNNQ